MPGREIKGTSKIATYRHGGRAGFKEVSKKGTFFHIVVAYPLGLLNS